MSITMAKSTNWTRLKYSSELPMNSNGFFHEISWNNHRTDAVDWFFATVTRAQFKFQVLATVKENTSDGRMLARKRPFCSQSRNDVDRQIGKSCKIPNQMTQFEHFIALDAIWRTKFGERTREAYIMCMVTWQMSLFDLIYHVESYRIHTIALQSCTL